MAVNSIHPSKELTAYIGTELDDLTGLTEADVYYGEHDNAVIVTSLVLVEVFPDPDKPGYLSQTTDLT